jgi:hypothetical protein
MVPGKYGLAAVGRYLIEQFELRRPGLREWTPQFEASLREQAEAEIVQMERQLKELEIDDPQYWQRVRRVIDEIILPRYAKVVTDQLALEKREYGLWRGGDLVARGTYAVAGFILGIIAVEVPYIPIYAKWFPAVTLIAGPLLPDLVVGWYRLKYRRKLNGIVRDLGKVTQTLDTYRPLSELTQSMRADLAEAPAVPQRERSH